MEVNKMSGKGKKKGEDNGVEKGSE